ncbi:Uncharacterized protein Fot_17229 [Forsythia ovata]|uniref:Uncharacterized protein n=1 Tax=Forsythia ovata TaxID=205694 RepID=A0ABD1VG30_9LAMI
MILKKKQQNDRSPAIRKNPVRSGHESVIPYCGIGFSKKGWFGEFNFLICEEIDCPLVDGWLYDAPISWDFSDEPVVEMDLRFELEMAIAENIGDKKSYQGKVVERWCKEGAKYARVKDVENEIF